MTSVKRIALVTPSYAGDFERCRLLCDSVDAFIGADTDHFILVDDDDYSQFTKLAGPRRHIINELDILPDWLHSMRPGLVKSSRKLWWSTKTWPLRGWHVQQFRRIAIANYISHEGLLYCDSDMLFVKQFSTAELWKGENLRLYRKPNGIDKELPDGGLLHKQWTRGAAKLNGCPEPSFPAHDYINNLVSWRRQSVLDMCANIEQTTGKHWLAAIGSHRSFSECQIYGSFADNVQDGAGHWHAPDGLCQTYWSGKALTKVTAPQFVKNMKSGQVAVGIQSFTGTDPAVLRQLISH